MNTHKKLSISDRWEWDKGKNQKVINPKTFQWNKDQHHPLVRDMNQMGKKRNSEIDD
jgi:hypothetical protein